MKNHIIWLLLAGSTSAGLANLCIAQEREPGLITAIEATRGTTTPGTEVSVFGRNFSPDSTVYFCGLQARQITYVNSGTLRIVTPYLRPGLCDLELKSGDVTTPSEVKFSVVPAHVDSEIDQAEAFAAQRDVKAAIGVFTSIATSHPDYDVRAYAHYRAAQLYLAQGDVWNGAEQAALIWDAKVSRGVQTSWRYRLLYDQTAYSVSESNDHGTDVRIADASVKMDVTKNPEPRCWRAIMNARFGKLERANSELKLILAAEPDNTSYRALAAYIGALTGDKSQLEAFRGQEVNEARSLALLGQAAYTVGDTDAAQGWWAAQAKISVTEAKLDCLAGQKHLHYGQTRVGSALLAECVAVVPDSSEGKEAKSLLATLTNPVP